MYARLDQASARTGLPVNSIVIAACLDWLQRHIPTQETSGAPQMLSPEMFREAPVFQQAPRWATLRRAVELAANPLARHPETYPFDRFTDNAKELLTAAQREASRAGVSYIGTEHLLLASFGNPEFHAAKVLALLGIKEEEARSAIDKAIGGDKRSPQLARIVPTERVKRVIEIAFKLCGSMGDARVGTNHLLVALATEGHGIAAHVLHDLGAAKERIVSTMPELSEPEA
jgi:hypothetical protein